MKPQPSLKKSPAKAPAERVVKDIRRQTRRHFSAEDKIRIVLEGLRGEDSIAELCRKEGIAQSLPGRRSSWRLARVSLAMTADRCDERRAPVRCKELHRKNEALLRIILKGLQRLKLLHRLPIASCVVRVG